MKIFLPILVLLSCLQAEAAGILAICSKNTSLANCPDSKLFFPVYKTNDGITTFNYKIDQGPLGELSNSETVTITEDLLSKWANESSLSFIRPGTGFLDVNVNESNYLSYLEPNSPLGYSPVIWDADGDIIEDILGGGTREYVLGFAGATCYNSSNLGTSCSSVSGTVNRVVESQALLNGYLFNGDNTNETSDEVLTEFKTTVLHEFAHMFSIDHTQGGNLEGYNNETGDYTDIPVMFPTAANPLEDLQQDDIAAVRYAYPKGDEDSLYGKIEGVLQSINSKGKAKTVKGANVVAYKIDEDNPRKLAVAAASDSDGRGNFVIPNLLPGEYILFAEPIDSAFTGGSSIGLHDPISPSKMTSGFYNGDNNNIIESTDLDIGIAQAEKITVEAGSNTEVVFITDEASNCNFPDDNDSTFYACGRAFNGNAIAIKLKKKKLVKAKIVNQNKGEKRSLTFSTDYPNLIKFKPATLNFKKRSRKVKIKIASYLDLVETFPELEDFEEVTIPVTITDTTTGYVDNGNSLVIF